MPGTINQVKVHGWGRTYACYSAKQPGCQTASYIVRLQPISLCHSQPCSEKLPFAVDKGEHRFLSGWSARTNHSACSALNGTSVLTKNKQRGMQEPEKGK